MREGYRALANVLQYGWNYQSLEKDLIFVCEGGTIQAHKFVISMCLSFLNDLLEMNKDIITTIHITDIKFEDMYEALNLLYLNCDSSKLEQLINSILYNRNHVYESVQEPIVLVEKLKDEVVKEYVNHNEDDDKSVYLKSESDEKYTEENLDHKEDYFEEKNGQDYCKEESTDGYFRAKTSDHYCGVCDEYFSSTTMLRLHKTKKHKTTFLLCGNCPSDNQVRYESRLELINHINKTKCDPNHDDRHYNLKNCTRFKCWICKDISQIFKTQDDYFSHLKDHHNKNEAISKDTCKKCEQLSDNQDSLIEHVIKRHRLLTFQCEKPGCKWSNSVYTTRSAILAHQVREHFGIYRQCPFCPQTFKGHINKLTTHISNHHSKVDESCTCHICGKIFMHINSLKSHINIYHSDKVTKYCKECDLHFPDKISFHIHSTKHSAKRAKENGKSLKRRDPIPCLECGKMLLPSKMIRHELQVHRRGNQIKCYICHKPMTNIVNVQRHVKNIHNETSKSYSELAQMFNINLETCYNKNQLRRT